MADQPVAGQRSPMFANLHLAQVYGAILGILLVAMGLLGFVSNPVVSDPSAHPIFVSGTVQNLGYLIIGALFIYVAFGLSGNQQALGLLSIGVLIGLFVVGTFLSNTLYGILDNPVNRADQLLHALIAVATLLVGWLTSNMAPASLRRSSQ